MLLLAGGALALYLLNASGMVLADPDEGRYALIARQMMHARDWLAPQLFGRPYFDKPIGFFWLLISSFELFGVGEFAARLVPALGAAVLVAGTYQLGRVLLTPRAALLGTLVLASSSYLVIAGRFVRMDGWLAALVTWGIYCWARVYFTRASRWCLGIGYACLAAAILVKGLIGVLLPLAVIGAFLLQRRDWRAIWRAALLPGLVLIVLLAGPWFAYMEQRFPGYAAQFFWGQHFVRATTDTFGRSRSPIYIPAAVLGGFLPWTALLVVALFRALPLRINADRLRCPGLTLCYWWAGLGIIPFMFSRSQLAIYALPALPPLALVAGAYVERLLAQPRSRETRAVLYVTVALLLAGLAVMTVANVRVAAGHPVWTALRRCVVALPAMAVAAYMIRRGRPLAAGALAGALALAGAIDVAWVEGPAIFRQLSSQCFVDEVAAAGRDAELLLVGPTPTYALPFYVGDTIEVRYLDRGTDFLEYVHDPRVLIGLLTTRPMYKAVQERVGERLELLAQRGPLFLVKVKPERAGANAAPGTS
jgi:4-amino-4-deoxy-L-arabinose transferase-like glycosyltransferase